MHEAFFETPLGTAKMIGDDKGIASLKVLDEKFRETAPVPLPLQEAVLQIKEYFSGTRTVFQLKLQPSGTEFQKKIWTLLMEIPFGKTISYNELSLQFGDPKAIRAVASANGKNPLWIIAPCHRVIGSNGALTGYAGGLWRKKWLLEHENPQQQKLF